MLPRSLPNSGRDSLEYVRELVWFHALLYFTVTMVIYTDMSTTPRQLYCCRQFCSVSLYLSPKRSQILSKLDKSLSASSNLFRCFLLTYRITPATCSNPVCNNDIRICPGSMVCEPVADASLEQINSVIIYLFTAEYLSKLFTCWAVSPRWVIVSFSTFSVMSVYLSIIQGLGIHSHLTWVFWNEHRIHILQLCTEV